MQVSKSLVQSLPDLCKSGSLPGELIKAASWGDLLACVTGTRFKLNERLLLSPHGWCVQTHKYLQEISVNTQISVWFGEGTELVSFDWIRKEQKNWNCWNTNSQTQDLSLIHLHLEAYRRHRSQAGKEKMKNVLLVTRGKAGHVAMHLPFSLGAQLPVGL